MGTGWQPDVRWKWWGGIAADEGSAHWLHQGCSISHSCASGGKGTRVTVVILRFGVSLDRVVILRWY